MSHRFLTRSNRSRWAGGLVALGVATALAPAAPAVAAGKRVVTASAARSATVGTPFRVSVTSRTGRGPAVGLVEAYAKKRWRVVSAKQRLAPSRTGRRTWKTTVRPSAAGILRLRAVVRVAGRARTSKPFLVRVAARPTPGTPTVPPAAAAPGGGPDAVVPPADPATPAPAPAPAPTSPTPAPAVPDVVATATPTTLMVGSSSAVELPASILSLQTVTIEPVGPASGASLTFESGTLRAVAEGSATPGDRAFTVTGTGCTSPTDCGRTVELRVPVRVDALAPLPAGEEAVTFTAASPDRVEAGEPLPGPLAGDTLRDELLITVGTPESPGSRAEADAAATAAGGVVSGGVEEIGVYEVRWSGPQDLAARKAELADQPNVNGVEDSNVGTVADASVRPGDWDAPRWAGADRQAELAWPYRQIRAPEAWDRWTEEQRRAQPPGSDVKVGVVESGSVLAGHEDLNVDRFGSDAGVPSNHSTHVAGLACGRQNGLGVVGVAWGCPVASRNTGSSTDKDVVAAMARVAATPGVRVVNMSISSRLSTDIVSTPRRVDSLNWKCATREQHEQFMRYMYNGASSTSDAPKLNQVLRSRAGRDIVWVVAAGNSCAPGVYSPWGLKSRTFDNVIAVASTNSNGTLSQFSNYGDGVKVAAPGGVLEPGDGGDGTRGLWSTSTDGDWVSGSVYRFDYERLSGTSMAAPIVSGVVALVRSEHPGKSAAEAARCVVGTAGRNTGTVPSRSAYPEREGGGVPFAPYESGSLPIVDADAAVGCELGQGPVNPTARVQITWDTPTDVDLHIWDAQGRHAFYGNRTAIPDGQLLFDDTEGYGPEEYFEDRDFGRRYTFGICQYSGSGANVTIRVFDPNGQERVFHRRLGSTKAAALIAVSPTGVGFTPSPGWCGSNDPSGLD